MSRKMQLQEIQSALLNVMVEFDKFCRDNNLQYYLIGGSLLGAVRHKGFIPWDDDMDVGMIRSEYERFLELASSKKLSYELKNYRCNNRCDYVITRLYIDGTFIDNPIIRDTKLDKRLYFDIFPLDFIPEDAFVAQQHEKRVLKKKKLLSYVDFREYGNGPIARIGKKVLSLTLSPFRQAILHSLEDEMTKVRKSSRICSLASQYSYQKQNFPYDVYGAPKEYEFCGYRFYGPSKSDAYLTQLYGGDYMDLPPVEKRRKGWDIYEDEGVYKKHSQND